MHQTKQKLQQMKREQMLVPTALDSTGNSGDCHQRLPMKKAGPSLRWNRNAVCPYPIILTGSPHLSLFVSRTNYVPQELAQKGQKKSLSLPGTSHLSKRQDIFPPLLSHCFSAQASS